MSNKKLKRILILCLVLILVLILISSCKKDNFSSKQGENEPGKQVVDVNIGEVHRFEKLDYNNLSNEEMNYVSNMYPGTAMFTDKGVEVYHESVFSGKLEKIITSNWPETEIGKLIPEPKYGILNKIEYADNWITVYIEEADKSDAKDYLKRIEEYGFDKNETKDDGKIMLKYDIYNEAGDLVTIKFLKGNETLEIKAQKAK